MHFTRFSKSHLLFEIHFCEQAPGSINSSQLLPSVHTKHPGKEGVAMWPLGGGDGAARRNPAGPAAPLAGEGAEGRRSSPWLGLGWSWGLESRR
jgi:hypothetical protein